MMPTLNKGDLFLFEQYEHPRGAIPAVGVILEHWGRNSHNEKMYKIFAGGLIEVISEMEIKKILSILPKKRRY
jgi:signal peptidase I|tara:strand:- start:187 stop:405 length:219 start_codon:yes stop_codon:yes gene_type:complete